MLRRLLTKLLRGPADGPRPSADSPIVAVPSPVAWIGDAVWSRWMWKTQFTDRANEHERTTIREPRLYISTPSDLERVRSAPVPHGAPLPSTGTLEEHLALLASTPPASGVLAPSWPICCVRLTSLIHEQGVGQDIVEIESHTGPLDRAYVEAEVREDWSPRDAAEIGDYLAVGYRDVLAVARRSGGTDGLILHQCRACGRVYVGSCHP